MRHVTAKEMEHVWKLDSARRYERFVKRVADAAQAWGLWDDGWASYEDAGEAFLPLWPDREYADACRAGGWEKYAAREIPVDELLELLAGLRENGVQVAAFPRPDGNAATVAPDVLAEALRGALGEYEG